ncbi:beta-ketoacyl synthase N-terminal-like domain-containing protein [Actinoplanes sp. NPDC049802]|uniref:polyketide synthase n=1 Tax=Actinoplanes sp. NPDC049802 TaxID=3154742 RepID=UPI0033DA9530
MRAYLDSLESLSRQQLMLLLLRRRQDDTEGIAVVGMACRLPGGITGPDAYWAALTAGRVVPDETTGVPVDSRGRPRWNVGAPDLAPLADVLAHGAYLDDVDVFDAGFFGVPEDEAPYLDPQQRILMTCAAEAVADANLTRDQLGTRRVGVFTAATSIEYHQPYLRNGVRPGDLSRHVAAGGTLSGTAGRVATGLGLHGPAMTVDTACSSALTALHLATVALRRRECDLAVVGACHLLLSPWTTAAFARTGVLSASGRCRPFAAGADGYVRSEGCGVVVLQRERDAVADGALPHAVVRGTAVHQHGDRLGLSVASALSQRFVMEEALRQAQTAAEDVAYVEAQANGLKLPTVVEAEAIAAAYRRTGAGAPRLYVGSAKANLGYLETASGMAGLIKTVLAVRHGTVPRQPDVGDLDPDGGWHRGPLSVPVESVAWPDVPRRLAGVSAFGFTGTDAHAILEAPADRAGPSGGDGPAVLALSAHHPAALRKTAATLLTYLETDPRWTVDAVCRTLAVGRDVRAVRAAAVVHDRAGLLAALSRWRADGAGAAPDPARIDPADRLQLMAARFAAGGPARPADLWDGRDGLVRLPPPALTGRSWWPEQNRWS